MTEMYNGAHLTPLEQAEVDVHDALDELDAAALHGERDRARQVLDEAAARAYADKDFFDVARAVAVHAANADPARFEGGDVGKRFELGRLHAITERPPTLQEFAPPKPEDLPNWQTAADSVARAAMTQNRDKAKLYHQGIEQRSGQVDEALKRMQIAINNDPDILVKDDPASRQFQQMYEFYAPGQAELHRQKRELTPEGDLNRLVDNLSVAIEANQVPPNVLNKYLEAHTKSEDTARGTHDKSSRIAGNMDTIVEGLKRDDREVTGVYAEATIHQARTKETAEKDKAHLDAEGEKIAAIQHAISRLNPNIIRERYESRLHETTHQLKERAFAAIEQYRADPTNEHAAHVAIEDMQTQANFFSAELAGMQFDRRGDRRTIMPPEYTVVHRMHGEAQAALLAMNLQKRVHDFEVADGQNNFRGHPPISRNADGGYRVVTGDHALVLYPDRSYQQGHAATGVMSPRQNFDGSPWVEGQVTPDMLQDRNSCEVYAATTTDGMMQRVRTLRGYWLANQGDPAISRLAARETAQALHNVRAHAASLPPARRNLVAPAINTLEYQLHQYRGEGEYDRAGRGLLTVQETRGADHDETWEVTLSPRGRRTERRL